MPRKIKWDKVDQQRYKDITEAKISQLLEYMDDDLPAEVIITRINQIVTSSAEECSPPVKPPGKTKTYKWSPILKPLVAEIKGLFWQWKNEGNKQRDPATPVYKKLVEAKRELRRTQKQIMAEDRQARHKQIMEASENDNSLLYQLIRRQRNDGQSKGVVVKFKFDPDHTNSQVENWATYFKDLATPKDLPSFDKTHKNHMDIKQILLQTLSPCQPALIVQPSTINKHIRTLKNNKAADPYGVAAEHLKLAHPCINTAITSAVNQIFDQQKIPDVAKLGIITPVLKKKKPSDNPDNYRRITVNSIIGKIVDKEVVPKTREAVKSNRHQFGFKKNVSCNNASVLITEATMEAKDTKTPIYISYMDTSKAFDMVDHSALLGALHQQGVTGPLWRLYDNAYTDIRSSVKWEGSVSSDITEGQGIRQGAETSADAFNCKSDPMLDRFEDHPDCFKIGTTNVGSIMVADDLALASRSPHGLQSLVSVAEQDASTKQYVFSESKTKVQACNSRKPMSKDISLNQATVSQSDEETHLGIHRRADMSNKATLEARIQTSRRTVFALAGAGIYGFNGVSPITSKKLIDIFIMPRLTYGLETLVIKSRELDPMEVYFRELLRHTQGLPPSCANAACYLLIGALPVEAHIHIKALTLFGSIMRREESLEYEVVERQLAVKDSSSHSWAIHIKHLLDQYNLPRALDMLYSSTTKAEWKRCINAHVIPYWMDLLYEEARTKSTLSFLHLEQCTYNTPHHIWAATTSDPLQVHKACIHAQMLIQRYGISSSHTAKNKSDQCPCCKTEQETMLHFILKCKALADTRSTYLPPIIAILKDNDISLSHPTLLQAIMDPSLLTANADTVEQLITNSRKLCFHLHRRRVAITSQPDDDKPKNLSASKILRQRSILTYREPTVTTVARVRP